MFYITKEYYSEGGFGIPFHSWYEYSIETSKPSSEENFVKINEDKKYLKNIVKQQGSLEKALSYLFDKARDDEEIEQAFD